MLNKFCTHTRHTLNKTSRYRSPIGKNRLSRTYFPRAIILNNVSEQIFLYLGCPFFYKYRSMSCKRKYIDPLTRTCWTTSHFINRIYKVFIFRGYVPGEKPLIKNTCSKNKMLSLKGQIIFYLITNITPQDYSACFVQSSYAKFNLCGWMAFNNEKSENIWQAYKVEPLHWTYSMNERNKLNFAPLWLVSNSILK